MTYKTPIRAAKLNRKRLVLVLDTTIYIYDIATMNLVHVISSTPLNATGVCALASCHIPGSVADEEDDEGCHNLFAYPKSKDVGEVFIYDIVNLQVLSMIPAHTSALSALAFNNTGTRLATASVKGTVIKIFETPQGTPLFELRRGYSTYAKISSLCFDQTSHFLAVSSEKATIHVFKLDEANSQKTAIEGATEAQGEQAQEGWAGYLASQVAAYLPIPRMVTDVWSQSRSFAQARLAEGIENVSAITGSVKEPKLTVATCNGTLYQFSIPKEGGECIQEEVHSLDAPPPSAASEKQDDDTTATAE